MKTNLISALLLLLIVGSTPLFAQKVPYQKTLISLCDALLPTQITNPSDPNFGALVCPSTNPDNHPLHSRSAEAVYPFAIAYKLTGKIQYRDAAIRLGNWLTTTQETSGKRKGGWSENWPDPQQKGWYGTTTDQLISMAGSYPILKPFLNASEITKWNSTMNDAADFIVANFPMGGNINYSATGATTLLMAHMVADHPKQSWLIKADSLMNVNTLPFIDAHNFLTGEGNGVDEGYNIAQSIGYIALYGILKKDYKIERIAANLLSTHDLFVYPNGSVDNSWGTRSFKWSYESGTKTAPGVYFSFALLSYIPEFKIAGDQCLEYLNKHCMRDGWIIYGPHAANHMSSSPPCNYSTFARAQSIALAIEYGLSSPKIYKPFPAQKKNWFKFFPDLKVAVVRTANIMATVSAYGQIDRYPRESVSRGGSITNLWFEGFGENGFMQSSSSAAYKRIEALHMPVEKDLLPLTPRIEFKNETGYYSNIFEDSASMNVSKDKNNTRVSATGKMKTITGAKSKTNYSLTNRFYNKNLTKEYTVGGEVQQYRIIEPIVKDPGTTFKLLNDSTVIIRTASSKAEWLLKVTGSTLPFKITLGTDAEKYWCPFPGVEAYPILITFDTVSTASQTIKILIGKK